MDQNTYNQLDISFTALSASAATIGLLFTAFGLYTVLIQIDKIKESALTNIHTKWCDQSFDLIQFFAARPGIRDYFYCCKEIEPTVCEKDREYIYYAAEALANFIDQLLLQEHYLPPRQWQVWARFINSSFELSTVLSDFILQNHQWYSDKLRTMAQKARPSA